MFTAAVTPLQPAGYNKPVAICKNIILSFLPTLLLLLSLSTVVNAKSPKGELFTKSPEKNIRVETITIQNSAYENELGELLVLFKEVGINVINRASIKRKLNWLKHLRLTFRHPNGLNFKFKITGFQKLVFEFVFNDQDQLLYFTYRINTEEVYNKIQLDTKGFKSYTCYDTGVVVRGNTNHDIVRVY